MPNGISRRSNSVSCCHRRRARHSAATARRGLPDSVDSLSSSAVARRWCAALQGCAAATRSCSASVAAISSPHASPTPRCRQRHRCPRGSDTPGSCGVGSTSAPLPAAAQQAGDVVGRRRVGAAGPRRTRRSDARVPPEDGRVAGSVRQAQHVVASDLGRAAHHVGGASVRRRPVAQRASRRV